MSYRDSPAYQRMIQRLGKIRPEQRSMLNNLSLDAQFADEETRRALRSVNQQADTNYRNERLGLRRDVFDFGQRQDNISAAVGVGNVAASTYYGLERDKIDNALLKRKLQFMSRYKT